MTITHQTVIQLGIALLSGAAAWLTNDNRPLVRKWAPIFGLASQPFWFISAWQADAWGILLLSAWYTLCWARGALNGWVVK